MTRLEMAGLLVLLAFGALLAGECSRRSDVSQGRVLTDAQRQAQIQQARHAETVLESERVRDTVILRETNVRTLRDTVLLNLTDTVRVREFVYQTDTLRVACLRCVEQLRTERASAAEYATSLITEREAWKREAVKLEAKAKRAKWITTGAFIGGAALGAWVRGR